MSGRTVVCFDWGGVILRICRTFEEGIAAAGLDARPFEASPELYDVRRSASRAYQVGEIDDVAFFKAVSESLGGVYDTDEIALIHDAWLLGEYEGVGEIMAALNEAEAVTTAMLSNTNARHWARRERDFPTCGAAEAAHASHLLRLAKPDAAIFRAFEREVGAAPGSIVFFDDLEENVEAARAAGWSAVRIDHEAETAPQIRGALAALGIDA